MKCHVILQLLTVVDTTGTTYTFYETEKRKETIKEKTKTMNNTWYFTEILAPPKLQHLTTRNTRYTRYQV